MRNRVYLELLADHVPVHLLGGASDVVLHVAQAGVQRERLLGDFHLYSNRFTLKAYDGLLENVHEFGDIKAVFKALTVLSVELDLVSVHIDLIPLVVIVYPAVYQPEIHIDVHLHRLLKLHFILYIN
jgi:hypothetical protein